MEIKYGIYLFQLFKIDLVLKTDHIITTDYRKTNFSYFQIQFWMSNQMKRQHTIDRDIKEIVLLCIEEEESMTKREKEYFLKNREKIINSLPSRLIIKSEDIVPKDLCGRGCCIQ